MRKLYNKPEIYAVGMMLTTCIALSGGDQTDGKVNPPDDEVDADDALIHIREEENFEWGALW